MKIVWVGIVLLVSTVAVGVGCGPKEKYCYDEKLPCSQVKAAIDMDAAYEAPPPDADAGQVCTSQVTGEDIPCPG